MSLKIHEGHLKVIYSFLSFSRHLQYEALELRDKVKGEWHGKGITKAVDNVNNVIAPALVNKDFDLSDRAAIDNILLDLDGAENKSKLGANTLLGVSIIHGVLQDRYGPQRCQQQRQRDHQERRGPPLNVQQQRQRS